MEANLLLVSGRVQGVGFRWFTVMEARARGVRGYVRNLPDGRVEVFAQAEKELLDAFRARLREGPRGARVDEVEGRPVVADPALKSFEVTF